MPIYLYSYLEIFMLHLYQSNRLEYLATLMAKVHAQSPLKHFFAPEEVVIQSQGMRRYISQFLARENGIAANMRFSLPAGLTWRLMCESMPNLPPLSPFDTEVMRWRLIQLFQSSEFANHENFRDAYTTLSSYLANGALAQYQLAGQVADVFDQYLVYRPDWIEAWQQGKTIAQLNADNTQLWQAQLWRFLENNHSDVPHRVTLWKKLMHYLEQPHEHLPERLSVFGIAALAPMHLQLLAQLALHCEVYIFALNPSAEYWGKVVQASVILQQVKNGEDIDLSQQGTPLLASLGKQGRDFFDTLIGLELATDISVFDDDPVSDSLLHTIQHQIQIQALPEDESEQWLTDHHLEPNQVIDYLKNHDRSIQIHSAHSPVRELQILREHILLWLSENPDWQPHDIVVLTPRIEKYSPFIAGIFGKDYPGSQALPFSLSDVKLSRRQPLLQAIEKIIKLMQSRFEANYVLQVLDCDPVLRHFDLSTDDLPLLHDTVKQLNIRWGADAEQRHLYGNNDDLFTWQQGLERMILGWILPEQGELWHKSSPWHTNPNHLQTLSRFAAFVRVLNDTRQLWQTPATINQWIIRFRALLENFCTPDTNDEEALDQFNKALNKWQDEAELAHFDTLLNIETVINHISRFLHSQSDAGFLRGGITFCGMVPMRSLPFKAVCLLGLNDGDFPRNIKAAPFDLIAQYPRAGDRARRDDDRYLFLESILSAREILYLSYVGRDIRTDEELTPSLLINELVDTISALTNVSSADLIEYWVTQHPLQPFSQRYFTKDGEQPNPVLFSSRSDYAEALSTPSVSERDFFTPPEHIPPADPQCVIVQKELIHFWRNPIRYWLKHQLKWERPYKTPLWDSNEPFILQNTRQLELLYLQARQNNQSFKELEEILIAKSILPAGELGKQLHQDLSNRARRIKGELLPRSGEAEVSGILETSGGILHYHLGQIYDNGQIFTIADFPSITHTYGKLSASDMITLLLKHLIYCAINNDDLADDQRCSHYISLSESFKFIPISQSIALETLSIWLSHFQKGQHMPLPFFARVSWRTAIQFYGQSKKITWDDAIDIAAKIYHGGYQGFAEEDYPEVNLVFGSNPKAEPPYFSSEFRYLIETQFAPLQACLQELKEQSKEEE